MENFCWRLPFVLCVCQLSGFDDICARNWTQWQGREGQWPAPQTGSKLRQWACQAWYVEPCHHTCNVTAEIIILKRDSVMFWLSPVAKSEWTNFRGSLQCWFCVGGNLCKNLQAPYGHYIDFGTWPMEVIITNCSLLFQVILSSFVPSPLLFVLYESNQGISVS